MKQTPLLFVMSDYGLEGPYLGQIRAVLTRAAPECRVINLFADLPALNPRAAGVLVAAYSGGIEAPAVFLCVVDPGVGGSRRAIMVRSRGCWFVGPDNGLLDGVAAADDEAEWWEITWRPSRLSASFHGRDLFAPVAAHLAMGAAPEAVACLLDDVGVVPERDLEEVVYIDHFGNAMTGIRGDRADAGACLVCGDDRFRLGRAGTFGDVAVGEAFWYINSNGLVEIACNRACAADILGLHIGAPVAWIPCNESGRT